MIEALRRSESPVSSGVHHGWGHRRDSRCVPARAHEGDPHRWPCQSLSCPTPHHRQALGATGHEIAGGPARRPWCARSATREPPPRRSAGPAPPGWLSSSRSSCSSGTCLPSRRSVTAPSPTNRNREARSVRRNLRSGRLGRRGAVLQSHRTKTPGIAMWRETCRVTFVTASVQSSFWGIRRHQLSPFVTISLSPAWTTGVSVRPCESPTPLKHDGGTLGRCPSHQRAMLSPVTGATSRRRLVSSIRYVLR